MGLLRTAVRDAGFVGAKQERVVNMLMQKTPSHYKAPFIFKHEYGIRSAFVVQALACILLSVSPNLVFLGMTQPFYHHVDLDEATKNRQYYPLVELLSETNRSPKGKHYLQKLRDVYLINNGNMGIFDSRDFVQGDMITCLGPFNRLPSIESVGIDLLEEDANNGLPGYEHKTSKHL
ncbi:hypothetical protein N7499_008438 [Penicillium canescens]|uniref:Uncharacterized protein n=1 Tax=Penicillium canescens TaxID=5083 RepID=A0AAD6HZX9_PENCN|nr:uncharacterized protein N7446_013470 [Penicillium canescens]KAJ6023116.1 hypothetical protein N7460_013511 [Penicillium canescens]KAJ6025619.1 hypothetical protein N7444_013298 [Penicillium canescens]KAJ6042404.1 hypothetical protein N7446_013470 [Penicillium canescens]KAJ6076457.1 hypothetical protein N7499_008438 [Penicillium canescens]KAJ6158765.1 hypothetical protein N7485_011591 [Penicillium canescens]